MPPCRVLSCFGLVVVLSCLVLSCGCLLLSTPVLSRLFLFVFLILSCISVVFALSFWIVVFDFLIASVQVAVVYCATLLRLLPPTLTKTVTLTKNITLTLTKIRRKLSIDQLDRNGTGM
jgi:hypothetical protein